MKKLLFMLGFLCFSGVSLAQITLTNLPSTTGNTRFFSEIHSNIKRPGLSVIGFDNGGNDQFGYGLEQVIENIYNGSDEIIFEEILDIAKTSITSTPTSSGQAETNGNILQYAAFEPYLAQASACALIFLPSKVSTRICLNTSYYIFNMQFQHQPTPVNRNNFYHCYTTNVLGFQHNLLRQDYNANILVSDL